MTAGYDYLRKQLVGSAPHVDGEDAWLAERIAEAERMDAAEEVMTSVALGRIAAIASHWKDQSKREIRSSLHAVENVAAAAYAPSQLRGYRVTAVGPELTLGDLTREAVAPTHVFLRWLHDRVVFVYGESSNLDWVLKLEALVVAAEKDELESRVPCYRCGSRHPAWTHLHLDAERAEPVGGADLKTSDVSG